MPNLAGVSPGVLQHCGSVFQPEHTKGMSLTTLLGSDSVDRVVRVTLSPDSSADGNGRRLALDGLAVGVDVGDLDLDRGVVLGRDQSVWRQSLDCSCLREYALVAEQCRGMYRSTRTPLSFSTLSATAQFNVSAPAVLICAPTQFDRSSSPDGCLIGRSSLRLESSRSLPIKSPCLCYPPFDATIILARAGLFRPLLGLFLLVLDSLPRTSRRREARLTHFAGMCFGRCM
jgi:hypothetical protein